MRLEDLIENGLYCLDIGEYHRAESYFKKGLKKDPNSDNLWYYLGQTYRISEIWEDAIKAYEKSISLNPSNYKSLNGLGICLNYLGDYSQAQDLYEKALELNPKDTNALNNLGTLYYDQKKIKEALDYYGKALEIDPFYETPYDSLINLLKSGELNEEESRLGIDIIKTHCKYIPQIKMEDNPGRIKAIKLNEEGKKHYKIFNYDKAKKLFKKALKFDPELSEGWYNLGQVYRVHDYEWELDSAIKAYYTALSYKLINLNALNALADCYIKKKEYIFALLYYHEILFRAPDNHIAWSNIGYVFSLMELDDIALEFYFISIKIKPDYEQAKSNLFALIRNQNQIDIHKFSKLKIPEDQLKNMILDLVQESKLLGEFVSDTVFYFRKKQRKKGINNIIYQLNTMINKWTKEAYQNEPIQKSELTQYYQNLLEQGIEAAKAVDVWARKIDVMIRAQEALAASEQRRRLREVDNTNCIAAIFSSVSSNYGDYSYRALLEGLSALNAIDIKVGSSAFWSGDILNEKALKNLESVCQQVNGKIYISLQELGDSLSSGTSSNLPCIPYLIVVISSQTFDGGVLHEKLRKIASLGNKDAEYWGLITFTTLSANDIISLLPNFGISQNAKLELNSQGYFWRADKISPDDFMDKIIYGGF